MEILTTTANRYPNRLFQFISTLLPCEWDYPTALLSLESISFMKFQTMYWRTVPAHYSGSHFSYDCNESSFHRFLLAFFFCVTPFTSFAHFSPGIVTIFLPIYAGSAKPIRCYSAMGIKIFFTLCFLLILFITQKFSFQERHTTSFGASGLNFVHSIFLELGASNFLPFLF